jgi:hypothetical protein
MSTEDGSHSSEPEAEMAPRRFDVNNPAKFYGIMTYLMLASCGWLVGRMDTLQWAAVTGPIIGYLVGNGVNAVQNKPTEPVFKHRSVPEDE